MQAGIWTSWKDRESNRLILLAYGILIIISGHPCYAGVKALVGRIALVAPVEMPPSTKRV